MCDQPTPTPTITYIQRAAVGCNTNRDFAIMVFMFFARAKEVPLTAMEARANGLVSCHPCKDFFLKPCFVAGAQRHYSRRPACVFR